MTNKLKILVASLLILVLVFGVATVASANALPPEIKTSQASFVSVANGINVRVYYLNEQYDTGKHAIIKVWCDQYGAPLPEDNPDTAINAPYSVLEFDLKYNRATAWTIQRYETILPNGQTIRNFYVNGAGQLCKADGSIVQIALNPEVEAYKLSQLKGMTQAQLEAYIDTNVTNLADAKAYLKKLSAVVLWLVKQSGLDN